MIALFAENRHARKAEQVQGDTVAINLGSILQLWKVDYSVKIEGRSKPDDVAYLHHTSGTSTGLPKPIPQTHNAACGVLPSFPNGGTSATFSTTPLYHGGIADCFRAWTSGALIWLFPEAQMPITGANILKCLTSEAYIRTHQKTPPIEYFSSVPYVLQMLAEEWDGIFLLSQMKIVGVGGAALPPLVGDRLVGSGVNLISRFGSAECGFLMSSHRSHAKDSEWQYLRPEMGSRFLDFEAKGDGLSELIVKPGWPHMAKKNRGDGSYATSDLFEPHPNIRNAWRYHSRADSQITLITGKKFDPAPIEAAIVSSSSAIKDVLIFGTGENYPGALLFPAADFAMTSDDLVETVWPSVEQMNQESQSHARISKAMLVPVTLDGGNAPLEKSSKGTILRGKAEERYAKEIESAYLGSSINGHDADTSTQDIGRRINLIVDQILGRQIDPEQDLFGQGVDSMACLQIRGIIGKQLLSSNPSPLPLNVVYDCGSIDALANFIIQRRQSGTSEVPDNEDEELKLMPQLVEQYGTFTSDSSATSPVANGSNPPPHPDGHVVVLTGATGALGAHLLHLLRLDPSISKVYCLLRAATPVAAHERVNISLRARGKPGLPASDPPAIHTNPSTSDKIICLPCKLSSPTLGLSPTDYETLSSTATMLIHSAWAVNFDLRLKSFIKDHIAGTRHLLDLARHNTSTPTKFLFISSTASVTSTPSSGHQIPESSSPSPTHASPLGYSRSKWVAESICSRAAHHHHSSSASSSSTLDISILRVGQLCGDTDHGIWNASEAYPLLLSTARTTGLLPNLANDPLSWLPVDLAAKSVLEIASNPNPTPTSTSASAPTPTDNAEGGGVRVFHILNPHQTPTWTDILDHIRTSVAGLDIVEPQVWVQRLEASLPSNHPASALLGMWKAAYSKPGLDPALGKEGEGDVGEGGLRFDLTKTSEISETIRELRPLDKEMLGKLWTWIWENVGTSKG